MPKVIANCLVKNEERWIWYSIMSVIDWVDEIIVYDTGSTDKTADIVKSISNPKLHFKQLGSVSEEEFTKARQLMLENSSDANWILILDGDEIWTESALAKSFDSIMVHPFKFLVSRYNNMLGDVYHFQPESASKYRIGSHYGSVSIRFINIKEIPGLHFDKPYGKEGLCDIDGNLIQDKYSNLSGLVESPYLHMTHLRRSRFDNDVMQRGSKFKYEEGITVKSDFEFPKCFYFPLEANLKSPWEKRGLSYELHSAWQTPLRLVKRMLKR